MILSGAIRVSLKTWLVDVVNSFMIIKNCIWELENLGCKTVEVSVEKGDCLNDTVMCRLEREYEYLVFKVPPQEVLYNQTLARHGYYFVEAQISLKKLLKNFKS